MYTEGLEDKPKCHCGIFGIFGDDNSALQTYYGLHALQHRGQEASGIIVRNEGNNGAPVFRIKKGEGLVSEVFSSVDDWQMELNGNAAIGHNRYSTTGASNSRKNIQPLYVNYRMGNLAIAHNGNLTNEKTLREQLIEEGSIFQTTSDTEVFLHLIAKSRLDSQKDQVIEALEKIEGAFSVVLLTNTMLIAARDPHGFRPLAMGRKNGAFVFASETCAFDIISAEFIRDVEPGEVIIIDDEVIKTGIVKSYFLNSKKNIDAPKHCIFEYVYFSRPDSLIFGHSVDKIRRRLGKILAEKYPVRDKDGEKVAVISVPDSSNTAALGYASTLKKMGIDAKFEIGLIRSHYIGRTFIQPGQQRREIGVKIKFNPVRGVLKDKTIVVVDDSIVRGTTSKQLISLIRECGPKEIHMRISSPQILHPCYYGMDFPSKEELIANKMKGNLESIKNYLGVDSLNYLTIDELLSSVYEEPVQNFCTSCFSGNYPTRVDSSFKKEIYEIL